MNVRPLEIAGVGLCAVALVTGACGGDDGGQGGSSTTSASSTSSSGTGAFGGTGGGNSSGSGGATSSGTGGSTSSSGNAGLDHECDDWQNAHPEWLWCDDFDTNQDLTASYEDYSLNGFSASTADAVSGNYALRQHYTGGQVDAGWISKFYGDTLGGDYGPIQDHFYMRWFHKFEAGFQGWPPKMARITSIGPGWDKRFGVYYWIEDFEIVADVSTPGGWLPLQHSGFSYADPANIDRWVCHEMYVKANAPGQSDGAYTFWVDDVPVVEVTGVNLVGDQGWHFNNCMLDCYWNGGSPAEQNRYYDNFVISTERIGCGSGG